MTREMSDKKNLQEATRIKKSGYKTKVHANPHKDEIDEMIIDKRWSSKLIIKELNRLYPDEDHPSDRTVDNYRKKYLPEEILKNARSTPLTEELRDKLIAQFDPAMDGIRIWSHILSLMEKSDDMLDKVPTVPKSSIDLVKVITITYKTLCEEWARLGISESVPQEFTINTKKTYDDEELKEAANRIRDFSKRIGEIKEEQESDEDGDGGSDEGGQGREGAGEEGEEEEAQE